ncbi:MAG: rod shape-determining protein MreC [Hydrogenophilaceae bacterium]|nr:rod shape-determining protein MreC [Hydrogenophilaceae bacterium]
MSPATQAPMFVREMGLSARFGLYVLACLTLMAADARYDALGKVRTGFNAVIHPAQQAIVWPFDFLGNASGFFTVHSELLHQRDQLLQERGLLRARLQEYQALQAENQRLHTLAGLPPEPGLRRVPAEIIRAEQDPFSRKVIVNRGSLHGVIAGRPVIDEAGLIGQVTQVFPASSEVTLLTDHNQSAPVQAKRNGMRILVSGMGSDSLLEVRYLDLHADLKPGDILVTSGLDGIYPPGLPVARVLAIELPRHNPFARATCQPLGGIGQHRHVVILMPEARS